MASVEQTAKEHFAKVFVKDDWTLFKEMADINFAEAATLTKSTFRKIPEQRRLLVRNVRKRLLIGIGTELLIKAAYLKSGYAINKLQDSASGPKCPYRLADVEPQQLNPYDTFTLAQLTDQLRKVLPLSSPTSVLEGLRVAKVFRNKEGHVVTRTHRFDPSSYQAIERALVEIYSCAFGEDLSVRFAVAHGERGTWRVS